MKDIVFPLPLSGEYVGTGQWRLTKPFEYVNPPILVSVAVGFITDGASIPRFAWFLIGSPWSGKYARAAVIHDYLYHIQMYSRKKSDRIFLEGMKILGVIWWKRWLMHRCVRIAGWIPWGKKREE